MCYINNMKKTVLIILIAAVSASSAYAENDFDKWKKKQKKAFKSFLSEQEKAFSDMLKKEWEEFQTQAGFIIDTEPKPVKQPEAPEEGASEKEISPDRDDPKLTKPGKPENLSSDSRPEPDLKPGSIAADNPAKVVKETGLKEPGLKTSESPGKSDSPKKDSNKESESISPGTSGKIASVPAEKALPSPGGEKPAERPVKLPAAENKMGIKYLNIDFYGSPLSVPLPSDLRLKGKTGRVNNKSISEFFEYYSEQKMDPTSDWLKSLNTDYKMNGWSVLKIAEKTSAKLYSAEKDRILMTWFLLIKSGYDVKIAYSDWNVYLLYVPEVKVYAAPYITEKNKHYYFYNKTSSKNEKIRTYSGDFVKKPEIVRLTPENPELFKSDTQKRNTSFTYKRKKYPVSLEYNNSLINYYNEYPQVDISYYFRKNVSEKASESYRKSLYPYIKGMDEKDAVQFILTFVQKGFKYRTDDSQFGYEKPMFPDETLHYPYIDCEDRSALFISIVKELTGLDAVALDYPGHIAAAVNFSSKVKGDNFTYNGKKYTVCDPTYINASVGMTMPDYKKVKPVIIETEN